MVYIIGILQILSKMGLYLGNIVLSAGIITIGMRFYMKKIIEISLQIRK